MNSQTVFPQYRNLAYTSPMRAFLYGTSAFSFWLTFPRDVGTLSHVDRSALKDCAPTTQLVDHLVKTLPQLPRPYELLVPARTNWPIEDTRAHASTFALCGKPFLRIANGIFAASPELCFVQLARTMSSHELIRAGNALCGLFYLDPTRRGGLGSGHPLTTAHKLASFIERNAGLPGVKAARKALPFLCEKTASPPESFLSMLLELPHRLGGFNLSGFQANQRLASGRKTQTMTDRGSLVPDLLHRESKLAIEYDSNAEHLTSRQVSRDSTKRLALEAKGFKVITVTTKQLASPTAMRHVAEQAAQRRGRRLNPKSTSFDGNQQRLFDLGWNLNSYLSPLWTGEKAN